MAHLEDAHKTLRSTERSLRELIERALSEQQYSDVAAIAQMADAVARLVRADDRSVSSARQQTESGGATVRPASPRLASSSRDHRGREKSDFPRFEREGNKLIKIGWSKRDERVYERRASREVVFRVTNTITSKVRPRSIFTMDQVLPINDEAGKEIPSYQAYLTLGDHDEIDRVLSDLHTFKNNIFFGSITQRASELFE